MAKVSKKAVVSAKTLDQQMFRANTKVKYCSRCVTSTQRPRLEFDENMVCAACQYAYKKQHEIDWKTREKELVKLCNKYRSKDGSYDVVVPGSGGKDSGYVAHLLKSKYGMHPLCVTWAPFKYTDIGWQNFNSFVDSGFDNLTFFQGGKLHRKLARLAFEFKGDPWEPFTYGQKAFAFHIALKFKIPLIFYGENGEAEYGGSMKSANKPYESVTDWEELYFKGAGIDKLIKTGLKEGILDKKELNDKSFELYKIPDLKAIKKLGAQMHWMSYYHKWIPQENYYYATEHTGFHANPVRSEGTYSKYASLDDRMDGFHWYTAFIKFGIARATSDAALEIRSGHLTREEGIALVKRYDGEFPKKYFQEFLDYLGITEKKFWQVIDTYRAPHIWKKVGKDWKLRHTIWGGGTDD